MTLRTDVVVVAGGQAGLAAGCHLRRLRLDFDILDALAGPHRRRPARTRSV
ncbi:hypothetical protein ACWCPS_25680 [Streptomyces mauvecolor]